MFSSIRESESWSSLDPCHISALRGRRRLVLVWQLSSWWQPSSAEEDGCEPIQRVLPGRAAAPEELREAEAVG